MTIAVALPVAAIAVIVLLLVEIRQYRTGRSLISKRRFVLRLVAGLLMILLVAGIFAGLFLLGLRDARTNPPLFVGFWSGCLAVALALIWVMVSDMREVGERFTKRQHEIWREMARFVATSMRPGDKDKPGSAPEGEGEE
jgi:hypothetical protein